MNFDWVSLRETLTESRIDVEWIYFGLAAQSLIVICLVVHWYASRKRKRVIIPIPVICLGLIATVMLLVYASVRHDLVFVVGQLLSVIIGLRLLEWIRLSETKQTKAGNTSFPKVEPDTAEINLDEERRKKS